MTNTHSTLKHKICTEWVTALCFSTYPVAVRKQTPPTLPCSWTDSWGPTKKSGLQRFCWLHFESDHLVANAHLQLFSASVFLPLFHVFFPVLRVGHQLGKAWLCFPGSHLENVISSWREKDTKTHDAFGEAQNNISGFRQQTLKMGRASPAAGEGWLKIIRQKKYCKMLPKDFKSLSGNRLIEISCLFFQKLFIFLFQSCVSFGTPKQTSGGLLSGLRLLINEYIWKICQSSATGLGFFHRALLG